MNIKVIYKRNFDVFLTVHHSIVCRLRADCSLLSTGILYGCLQIVTIPEAVVIRGLEL